MSVYKFLFFYQIGKKAEIQLASCLFIAVFFVSSSRLRSVSSSCCKARAAVSEPQSCRSQCQYKCWRKQRCPAGDPTGQETDKGWAGWQHPMLWKRAFLTGGTQWNIPWGWNGDDTTFYNFILSLGALQKQKPRACTPKHSGKEKLSLNRKKPWAGQGLHWKTILLKTCEGWDEEGDRMERK